MTNKQITIIGIIVGITSIIITMITLNNGNNKQSTHNSGNTIKQDGNNSPSIINNKGNININPESSIESELNNESLLRNKPDFIIKKVIGNNKKIIDKKIVKNKFGFDYLLVLHEEFNDPNKEYYLSSIKYDNEWHVSWVGKFKPTNLRSLSIDLSIDSKYYTSNGCTIHACTYQGVIFYSIKNDKGYSFFIYNDEVTVEGDFQSDEKETQEILEMLLSNVYDPLEYTIDKKALSYFPTKTNLVPGVKSFFRKKELKYKQNDKKYEYIDSDKKHLNKLLKEVENKVSSSFSIPDDYHINTFIEFNLDNDESLEKLVLFMSSPGHSDRFGSTCNYIVYLVDDNKIEKIAQSKESYNTLYCGNDFFTVVTKKDSLAVDYFSITQNTGSVFVDGSSNMVFRKINGSFIEITDDTINSSFAKKADLLLENYLYY